MKLSARAATLGASGLHEFQGTQVRSRRRNKRVEGQMARRRGSGGKAGTAEFCYNSAVEKAAREADSGEARYNLGVEI